ncbi:hypothetical protein TNCV_2258321 [Trichonephila clavipes]|nr:hypothetical protein TNCV_2258321 [Trichonephila clavipes]
MSLYSSNLGCRIYGFMGLMSCSQPPVGVKYSESRLITPCYSFLVLYTPVSGLYCPGKTCSPVVTFKQWHSRRSKAPGTHTVKQELHNPFTDCTTDTVIQLGCNLR